MDLLFKREQSDGFMGRIIFHLWAKSEFSDDERALLDRYRLDQAQLLQADDWRALRWAVVVAIISFFLIGGIAMTLLGSLGLALAIIGAGVVGFWFFNEKRETIFVKDLLYGRRFKCRSVAELARKEAWLEDACIVLRQVIETAKNWDGVETNPIPILDKAEAKKVVIRYA